MVVCELAVPLLTQPHPIHCGPTSLAMVAQFYGLEETPETVLRLFRFEEGKYGIHRDEIVIAARALGFFAYSNDHMLIDDLRRQIDGGTPVIVRHRMREWLDDPKVRHLSVVRGYDPSGNILRVNDPWMRKTRLSDVTEEEFLHLWDIQNGVSKDNTRNYGIVIRP